MLQLSGQKLTTANVDFGKIPLQLFVAVFVEAVDVTHVDVDQILA